MTQGRLIAVVGPSGVGKDSVMAGIQEAIPTLRLVRRVITRAPGLGGEDYDAVTVDAFHEMTRAGAFAIHWGAHGLFYGIPSDVHDDLGSGNDCLVNLSRKALAPAERLFSRVLVLHVTARPETLAHRLAARGRETEAEIADRMRQAAKPLPDGLNVIHLSNGGPLHDTVARAVAALQPADA
jgi:ribose 1,5-bisphosphokinase